MPKRPVGPEDPISRTSEMIRSGAYSAQLAGTLEFLYEQFNLVKRKPETKKSKRKKEERH